MKRILLGTLLINCAAWLASGQSTEKPPRFEAADVHASPRPANGGPLIPAPIAPGNSFTRTGPVRNGRYQVKNATMLATMVRKPQRMIPMEPLRQHEGDLAKVAIDLKDDVNGVEGLDRTLQSRRLA